MLRDGDKKDDSLDDQFCDEEKIKNNQQSKYEKEHPADKELIEMLENQVNNLDKLPKHERFSFVTNADLYYFMVIILNIFKKGL